MCEADAERILEMCGLQAGQYNNLPTWYSSIATKNITKEGKHVIIKTLLTNNLRIDDHPIPITPSLIQMIVKKAFTGEEDITAAGGAMKGLSPYCMTKMTAKEVEAEHDYAKAVKQATSATVADIQKLLKKKATAPTTFTDLIAILRTYANLLGRLFGPLSPLTMALLSDVIVPLAKLTPLAKADLTRETLASIMWAVYKQTKKFAMGQMKGEDGLVDEWICMLHSIKWKQNFTSVEIPAEISGRIVEKVYESPSKKSKQDAPAKGGGPKLAHSPTKMKIHPIIKEKLSDSLPEKFSIKKLAQACEIKDINTIWPDSRICLQSAIKGTCPFNNCRHSHDSNLVTDEMAKRMVMLFGPYLKDPSILKVQG